MELAKWRHHVKLIADRQLVCCELRKLTPGLHADAYLQWPLTWHGADAVRTPHWLAIANNADGQVLTWQECEFLS
jgi:hypothetical protein